MDFIEQAQISQKKTFDMLRKGAVATNEEAIVNSPIKKAWPDPINPLAYHGLAGEIVRTIEPHSEADPISLLANFLTAFGNVIGSKPHFRVEGDLHPMRLFCTLVGESSKARKGT